MASETFKGPQNQFELHFSTHMKLLSHRATVNTFFFFLPLNAENHLSFDDDNIM